MTRPSLGAPLSRAFLFTSVLALSAFAAGCANGPIDGIGDPQERVGQATQAETAQGDWTGFSAGQCVHGVYAFYSARFGVSLTGCCAQGSNIGTCENCGACMIWESAAVEPPASLFNKYAFGSQMPRTYDIVVYPSKSGLGYGHVAAVDHMDGSDPNAWQQLYVMDSNYYGNEAVAPAIHTVSRAPYGYFRLKSLDGPVDAQPKGFLDGADCDTGVRGWAQDPDAPDAAIDVHVYFNAGPGQAGAIGIPTHAGEDRADLCAAIGSCDHGFTLPIPYGLMDNAAHPVTAYGIDTAGGTNPELKDGPKSVTCAPPVPTGSKRRVASPDVLAAFQFSTTLDMAIEPDDVISALPDLDDWPAAPIVAKSDDGTDSVWFIDGQKRRLVTDMTSFAAWRFGTIETWTASKIASYEQGDDLRSRPLLIKGTSDDVYVVDAPPPPLPPPTTGATPQSSSSGSGGSNSVGLGAGGARDDDDDIAPAGPIIGSCSVSFGGDRSWLVSSALALLALASIRRRRRAA